MKNTIICPNCDYAHVDLCHYDSMMVLREDVALFSLTCPVCGAFVVTVHGIPRQLREEVRCAALELGAGMGQDN